MRRYLAAGRAPAEADERAYLAVLTVGGTGRHRRPRPVEIAVVTDDGAEASTVINPTSDLYSAATDFRLTARDVVLAPLLTEAWPVLGTLLAGRVPVGVGVGVDNLARPCRCRAQTQSGGRAGPAGHRPARRRAGR